jgi:hypothetical protein
MSLTNTLRKHKPMNSLRIFNPKTASASDLVEVASVAKLEEDKINQLKRELKDQIKLKGEKVDIDVKTFMTRNHESRVSVHSIQHELNSRQLMEAFVKTNGNPSFDRIIIGAGVAATCLFAELPQDLVKKRNDSFPAVLVLNDPDNENQWPKDKETLMGQHHQIQTPKAFAMRSEDLAMGSGYDSHRNPYNYVMADDFTNAMIESQNLMGMHVLNLKALRIETKSDFKSALWEQPDQLHRIVVEINGVIRYLYTKSIDLCTGPGESKKLEEKQIPTLLAKKLIKENRLIYGQDNGDPELKGEVVFYGAGARNAALILDMELGIKPGAVCQRWIGVNDNSFKNSASLNRMFSVLNRKRDKLMALGTLSQVEQLDSGKLKLTFSKPSSRTKDGLTDLTAQTIICDQLVIAIGQKLAKLSENFQNFSPLYYQEGSERIPIGTCNDNGSIVTYGAAGASGLGLKDDILSGYLSEVTAHARTLPFETNAPVGIYRSAWTIKELVSYLRKNDRFPMCKSSIHAYELPDINCATSSELMNVIHEALILDPILRKNDEAKKYTKEKIQDLVKEIIRMRAMPVDSENRQVPGIHNMKQLKGKIPDAILSGLGKFYFPFGEPDNIVSPQILPRKDSDKESKSERPGSQYAPRLFDFPREQLEDASIFLVSDEAEDIASNKQDPTSVKPLPFSISKVSVLS